MTPWGTNERLKRSVLVYRTALYTLTADSAVTPKRHQSYYYVYQAELSSLRGITVPPVPAVSTRVMLVLSSAEQETPFRLTWR